MTTTETHCHQYRRRLRPRAQRRHHRHGAGGDRARLGGRRHPRRLRRAAVPRTLSRRWAGRRSRAKRSGTSPVPRAPSWARPPAAIRSTCAPSTPRSRSKRSTAPMSCWKPFGGSDIEAVVSVVGSRALSILFKLHRKGLKTVCVPKSVENDMAATALSFGFNSALSFAVDTLDRARQAAESARKIGVVEVLGEHAGWLALQAGMAVVRRCGADSRDSLRPRHGRGQAPQEVPSREDVGAGGGGRGRRAQGRRPGPDRSARGGFMQGLVVARGHGPGRLARHRAIRPVGGDGGAAAAASDRSGDLPARSRPTGQRRASDRRRSPTGAGLRCGGRACAAAKARAA